MIHTAKQLKDKVKNISGGNSEVAQALIRNYFMERFLERVSVSEYANNFILKGGMLVASIVGVDMRATMDIDTTVRNIPLNESEITKIISYVCSVENDDDFFFSLDRVEPIREDDEYEGYRTFVFVDYEKIAEK